MSLKDPENIYLILLEEITGIKNVSRGTACILLSKIKFPQNTLLLEKILKDNLFRNNKLPKQYSVVPGNQSTK